MEYVELPPPPGLRHLVHCFWFLRSDHPVSRPQPVVPDGRPELIVHLGEPFARLERDGRWRPQARVLVAGQLLAPIALQPAGPAEVCGIRFTTAGAGNLFPSLPELTGAVEPLVAVNPRLAARLWDAAQASSGRRARVAAMARVLAAFEGDRAEPTVPCAVSALDAPDAPPVQVLARSLGLTTRTLERRVLRATGLSPVALRSVCRFRRAFHLLRGAPPGHWGRVAADSGYADQSHMNRAFRRFAGTSPARFLSGQADLALAFASQGSA